ncbi:MAG: endonuclease MutS2 [Lachnospiraceae bacterium]|jgi:DNA mismatch repair protein MutS2|nr:endonuclease MutS2 [uncultured Acetatifactor sp.]MCI9570323.1 endonuclease MutS2 [Lachnospiraceae bacterium]NBJ83460.1 endonuclease MutS2 [bacterium 1XD42-76]NBK06742.1 endonuclease MutS2 [bacterium 1XD42-94]
MNEKALKTLEFSKIIDKLTDFAASAPGRELCRSLLPSDDYDEIVQNQTETFDAATRVRQKGRLSLSGITDIRDSLKRLEIGSSLSIHELLAVSALLTCAGRAKSYGRRPESELPDDSLDESFRLLEPLTNVNAEITRCILSEEEVADDASPGLRHVRRQMKVTADRVHTQLNAILNSSRTMLQDAVITMRDGRYCLPVKSEYKSQFQGMVHDQSSTGSTLFIEPMAVVKLNNELRELEIREQKEIEMVLAALSASLTPYTEALLTDFHVLSRLDFIFAKAALSRHYNCSMPKFNRCGYIHIKDGRHPLLDAKTAVPINIYLGKEFDLLIVTGPNTGGKTVSLKTVGLFTLMGQAGLHIPAFEGSELSVFHDVFADIGDEQSIEQSLSTFSAHMTNIVSILNEADSQSLCLFDELGAGTDPTEGAALAIAVLSFLHNMGCRTMATTHYSELKVFALSTPGVENACCEFDVQTLRPTYRLLIGIPGKSNAFAISKKLGLPDYIIDDAKSRLEANDEAFEDLLANLESSRVTIEKEREEIASYKEEIARLKKNLEQKEERLDERRERLIRNANEEAQRILREAKDTADQTIRNINKLARSSGVGKELEAERAGLREKLGKVDKALSLKNEKGPQKTISPKKIRIGDGVRVLTMNLKGTVSSLPNAKGDLYVQMGILRSLVNIRDLELLDETSVSGPGLETESKNRTRTGGGKIKMSKSLSISPEVNLIGMTVDEAIPILDKYLDDAYLAHLPQVRVVHGRGTGALKAGVHKHLKRLKYVAEFRLGSFGEGDTGVTIVTFK